MNKSKNLLCNFIQPPGDKDLFDLHGGPGLGLRVPGVRVAHPPLTVDGKGDYTITFFTFSTSPTTRIFPDLISPYMMSFSLWRQRRAMMTDSIGLAMTGP